MEESNCLSFESVWLGSLRYFIPLPLSLLFFSLSMYKSSCRLNHRNPPHADDEEEEGAVRALVLLIAVMSQKRGMSNAGTQRGVGLFCGFCLF